MIGRCDKMKNEFDNEDHEAYIREHEDITPDKDCEMQLKAYDRQKLWGRAGAKCSICKRDLFQSEVAGTKILDTKIGEECHISSENPEIPSKDFDRYDLKLSDDFRNKSYDNAILLCRNCHAIIDDPNNTQYTIEALHQIKKEHEAYGTLKKVIEGIVQNISDYENKPILEKYGEDIVMITKGRVDGQIIITVLNKELLKENIKKKEAGAKDLLIRPPIGRGGPLFYKNPEDEVVDECEEQVRALLEEK